MDMTGKLSGALRHAVNAVTGTTVGAVARTATRTAPGSSLWLAGTTNAIHAEQAALAAAQHLDDGPVLELWITSSRDELITPCGACRQMILDLSTWQQYPITVVSWLPGQCSERTVSDLLPHPFESRHLRDAAQDA